MYLYQPPTSQIDIDKFCIETDTSQDGLPYLDLAQSTLPTPGDQEKLNVQVEIQASHLLLGITTTRYYYYYYVLLLLL